MASKYVKMVILIIHNIYKSNTYIILNNTNIYFYFNLNKIYISQSTMCISLLIYQKQMNQGACPSPIGIIKYVLK